MKKIVILLMVLLVAGGVWWYSTRTRTTPITPTVPSEDVTLRLKWLDQAQFAGNYVAVEKGFYKAEGLNVSLAPYSYTDSSIDVVLSGEADFGIAGAEEILIARSLGKPIKAVAVIFKRNPAVAFSLKGSGITKPTDFVGKRVGIEKGVNVEYLYAVMMSKLKIDRSKITEVSVGQDASEFLAGKVDVSTGYVINEPQLVIEAGKDVNTILMADYGANMYADVLFTTDDTIANKPDLTKKVLSATLKGWQYAFEHEQEAVDLTLKYAKNSNRTHQSDMLRNSIPLINSGDGPLGWMSLDGWQQAQDILLNQKIMKKRIDVSDAFTLKFLGEIYNR